MAIGSAPEIGRTFTKGVDTTNRAFYPWVLDDGTLDYLQVGEATLCFIDRPNNCYPRHHHLVIPPKILDHDDTNHPV